MAILSAISTVAASAAAECRSFDEAARLSGAQYVDLRLTRGSPIGDWELIPNDARGAILAYLRYPTMPGAQERNGLIFYHTDGEAICGYFWERGRMEAVRGMPTIQPDAVFRLPVESPEALSRMIEETLAVLTLRSASPARSPRPRAGGGETRSVAPLRLLPADADDALEPRLEALSRALFAEFASEVETLSSLTILPALNIGTVPFGALDPNGDGTPIVASTMVTIEESMKSIVDGNIFGMHPAAGAAEPAPIAPQAIAGDPDATGDPTWIFPRLPGAADEARAVAEHFRTLPLVGGDVTVATLKQRLVDAEYIHIAAHGMSSASNPMDGSFLALSDGRLTAREIQALPLTKAPLVVLSACQTGLGSPLQAGVIGLARAFIVAGASSVVASLWNVDDEATSWIMARFAEHISRLPPAEALRRTQDEARLRWPDPTIWASFMLFGARTIGLDTLPAAPMLAPGAFEVEVQIERDGRIEPITAGTIPIVYPDEIFAVEIASDFERPLEFNFLYMDAAGKTSFLTTEWLDAGARERMRIARFGDDPVGLERVVLVAREQVPGSAFVPLEEFTGASEMLTARALLHPASLGRLLPRHGIVRLGGFGASAGPGAMAPASEMVAKGQRIFATSAVSGVRDYLRPDQKSPRTAVMVFPVEVRSR